MQVGASAALGNTSKLTHQSIKKVNPAQQYAINVFLSSQPGDSPHFRSHKNSFTVKQS